MKRPRFTPLALHCTHDDALHLLTVKNQVLDRHRGGRNDDERVDGRHQAVVLQPTHSSFPNTAMASDKLKND